MEGTNATVSGLRLSSSLGASSRQSDTAKRINYMATANAEFECE
jgi:hypothetical protein